MFPQSIVLSKKRKIENWKFYSESKNAFSEWYKWLIKEIKPTINFTLQKYSAKERKPNKIGQEQKPLVSGFL